MAKLDMHKNVTISRAMALRKLRRVLEPEERSYLAPAKSIGFWKLDSYYLPSDNTTVLEPVDDIYIQGEARSRLLLKLSEGQLGDAPESISNDERTLELTLRSIEHCWNEVPDVAESWSLADEKRLREEICA